MGWWSTRSRERDQEAKSDESEAAEPTEHRSAASRIVDLQHAVGNQSVQRILSDGSHGVGKPLTKPPPTAPPGPGLTIPTYKDEELKAYTQDFLNHFHRLDRMGLPWSPLLKSYEESSGTAQKSALTSLVAYYANPPSPPISNREVPAIKKAFEGWLSRQLRNSATSSRKLIQDLSTALGTSLSATSPANSPAPAPTSGPIVPGAPH
jgi:hypothetical protein